MRFSLLQVVNGRLVQARTRKYEAKSDSISKNILKPDPNPKMRRISARSNKPTSRANSGLKLDCGSDRTAVFLLEKKQQSFI